MIYEQTGINIEYKYTFNSNSSRNIILYIINSKKIIDLRIMINNLLVTFRNIKFHYQRI